MNVYENCPIMENERFLIRVLEEKDIDDLLEVYSDKMALPFFNSDNCHGTNFYNTTREGMAEAVKWWRYEYTTNHGFVRFSIVDKAIDKVIGSIELFNRKAEDHFNDCGLLRLDVRSDYEKTELLADILSVITCPAYELFECSMLATKAANYAVDRIEALTTMGFEISEEPLVGHERTYYDYWERKLD